MLEELKKKVFRANLDLVKQGLVIFTWGNVAAIDRTTGLVVIKPSGVSYEMCIRDSAHTGHGHFHARRSKDLVNWEYLGGTMPKLPDWVMPKLNEIRKAMGLLSLIHI